jgi:hypothetical protein
MYILEYIYSPIFKLYCLIKNMNTQKNKITLRLPDNKMKEIRDTAKRLDLSLSAVAKMRLYAYAEDKSKI